MKTRRVPGVRGRSRNPNRRMMLGCERFEDRLLLTVFTVDSLADNPQLVVPNDGTLRGEIMALDAATGAGNTIDFTVTGRIVPVTPLPAITQQVTIDGTSPTGFSDASPQPVVDIDGSALLNSTTPGLSVRAAGVNVVDLAIGDFRGDGIDLLGGGAQVIGCHIGVSVAGESVNPNTGDGILVESANNTIGGTTLAGIADNSSVPLNPNVISSNTIGIEMTGDASGGNLVEGSYIGTDANGVVALPNTKSGIEVDAIGNTIGGTSAAGGFGGGGSGGGSGSGGTAIGPGAGGNLISGNRGTGILITAIPTVFGGFGGGGFGGGGNSEQTVVVGNYIGTDVTGLLALPNRGDGVDLIGAQDATIGGTIPGSTNVISANAANGVYVSGSASQFLSIEGNDIGVGEDQAKALGNGNAGVFIDGASGVMVGGANGAGSNAAYTNIIANNGSKPNAMNPEPYGVAVTGGTSDAILSNSIINNAGIGINLASGGNSGVQPPVSLAAESTQMGGGFTRITGTLDGAPNTSFTIQFFENSGTNAGVVGAGGTYLDKADLTLTTNTRGVATFQTLETFAVPVGDTLTATATQGLNTLNDTSEFATGTTVINATVTDLSVKAAVPSTPPLLDQDYTYNLTVTNNGPDPATGVVLTDTIPVNSVFVPAQSTSGTFSSGVLTVDVGDLAPGASSVVKLTVLPTLQSTSFINTPRVTGNELDTNSKNNTDPTTTAVLPDADMAVQISAGAASAPIGSPISYTLVVQNNGPSTSKYSVETVALPASFSNILVTPDQGSYSVDTNTNTITILTGTLGVSSSSTISIQATPTATGNQTVGAHVQSFTDAALTQPLADPNSSNDTATSTVKVAYAADLGVTINGSANPVLIGQEFSFTIQAYNNGPSPATMPAIFLGLPSNLQYVSASSAVVGDSFRGVNGGVAGTLATIPSGGTDTIQVFVKAVQPGSVTDTVTVGDPNTTSPVEIDPDLSNNTATVTTLVGPADVGVAIDGPNDPLAIGKPVTYSVVVTNYGPATATNVTLTDVVGSIGRITSISSGYTTGNTITAHLGTLALNASKTFVITVDPSRAGSLADSAMITRTEVDPNSNNDDADTTNLVNPVDVVVSATASSSKPIVGSVMTFTVQVTNNGPTTATNVGFTDTLPVGFTLVRSSTTQGGLVAKASTVNPGSSILNGGFGSIAPGKSATVTIYAIPNSVLAATNTASVALDSATDYQTNPSSTTATVAVSPFNQPGTFQFAASTVSVPEDAGSVTLTIDRVNGTSGAVSVNYATSNGSAAAGVNYVATTGTVNFIAGQATATITIPVLDDKTIDGSHEFFVTLSGQSAGASLGSPSQVGVVVTNTDRDTTPPTVTSLTATQNGSILTNFVVTFSKAMDPTRASMPNNYFLFYIAPNGAQLPVGIAAVQYNAANHTSTIIPGGPIPAGHFYRVVLNGSLNDVLTDTSGNVLAGMGNAGSNYDVIFGTGTSLTYDDSRGNQVNLTISGGGTLGVFLQGNGDAGVVNLYGIVPGKTHLSGSVTKLVPQATGYTVINAIYGLGSFGQVYSTLTTPSFYVNYAPLS